MKGKSIWLALLKENLKMAECEDTRGPGAPALASPANEVSEPSTLPADKTDKSPGSESCTTSAPDLTRRVALAAPGPEGRELKTGGWDPKERCGRTIWQSLEKGYWYGQETALKLLRLGESSREGVT